MAPRLSALRAGRRLTHQKQYFSASDTHSCQRMCKPQGLVRPEVLGKLMKVIHLTESRTRDLQACSILR
jgi:hypothetical protein